MGFTDEFLLGTLEPKKTFSKTMFMVSNWKRNSQERNPTTLYCQQTRKERFAEVNVIPG